MKQLMNFIYNEIILDNIIGHSENIFESISFNKIFG